MPNELAVVQSKTKDLRAYMQQDMVQEQFKSALPKWLSVDRFFRVVFTSILKNPKILDCTRESILSSLIQCAALGLEPIMGRAHLIPYNNSKMIGGRYQKVLECQFQPGYQGLIDLAKRSGDVRDVDADVVYENDIFEMEKGSHKHLSCIRNIHGDRGKKLGAFAIWYLKDGSQHFDFMDIEELYKIREKSQAYRYAISHTDNKAAQECPWIVWEDEQMKKTIIKRTSKLVPASIEFVEAVEFDDRDYKMSGSGDIIDLSTIGLGDKPKHEQAKSEDKKIEIFNNFNNLVLKETGKEVEDTDYLIDFIKVTAQKQKPEMTEYQLMAAITEKNFNAFWKRFNQYVEGLKPEAGADPQTQKSSSDSDNPFDQVDWESNRLREQGVIDFYYKNKKAFETASEKSQTDFKAKWERVVSGTPFPATNKVEEPKPAPSENKELFDDPREKHGKKDDSEMPSNTISQELFKKLEDLKARRPDLYGKAEQVFGEPENDEEYATLAEWIQDIMDRE